MMKALIPVLLVVLIAVSCQKDLEPEEVVRQTIEKYEAAQSMTYDIEYMWKSFDSDEPWYFNTSVALERVKEDSVFGGKLAYARKDSIFHVLKVYVPGKALYINHTEKEVTEYNTAETGKWPITGNADGSSTGVYFLDVERLNKKLANEEYELNYRDSSAYVIADLKFPDDEDYTGKEENIYFNKKNLTIDKIRFKADYMDQVQRNHWIISNIVFDELSDKYYEELTADYLADYKLTEYEEPDESFYDLLVAGETAPLLTGKYFPNYEEDVDLKLDKITILDFWYTTCMPCIKAIPELNKIKAEYGEFVDIVGVNPYETKKEQEEKINKFLNRTPMDYPIFFVDKIPEEYNIRAFPTLYVLDKDYKVLYTKLGYGEDLFDILDEELKGLKN